MCSKAIVCLIWLTRRCRYLQRPKFLRVGDSGPFDTHAAVITRIILIIIVVVVTSSSSSSSSSSYLKAESSYSFYIILMFSIILLNCMFILKQNHLILFYNTDVFNHIVKLYVHSPMGKLVVFCCCCCCCCFGGLGGGGGL